jgi:uncharacterized damage-inducible protein DinB
MIDSGYVCTMARYNRWQNVSLYGAAAELHQAERELDRGAFFKSIQGTFSHLMWADTMWMSRFSGSEPPPCAHHESAHWFVDFEPMRTAREALDAAMLAYFDALSEESLASNLVWHSRALNTEMSLPRWITVAHFFNHQTHHRGQVHAMLTAARPSFRETLEDTDLIAMPH